MKVTEGWWGDGQKMDVEMGETDLARVLVQYEIDPGKAAELPVRVAFQVLDLSVQLFASARFRQYHMEKARRRSGGDAITPPQEAVDLLEKIRRLTAERVRLLLPYMPAGVRARHERELKKAPGPAADREPAPV